MIHYIEIDENIPENFSVIEKVKSLLDKGYKKEIEKFNKIINREKNMREPDIRKLFRVQTTIDDYIEALRQLNRGDKFRTKLKKLKKEINKIMKEG